MAAKDALIACSRFGLGPRQGEIRQIAADPRGALLAQLDGKDAGITTWSPALASSSEALKLLDDFVQQRRGMSPEMKQAKGKDRVINPSLGVYVAEVTARLEHQTKVPIGFLERLVLFWSNHFCVAVAKSGYVRILAGAYEREAIRPHVLGKFSTMLRAAEQHPAMLIYLDNTLSFGPSSRQARKGRRGLNENLAREILELHTLGVDGGYSQADVTSLARIITGWTYRTLAEDPINGGRFVFDADRHEPGDHELLGQKFRDGGVEQGEAALEILAKHPSTARHIARKFAAHFVADDPPPALVQRLEKTFIDSGGDLGAMTRALITSTEAWNAPQTKLRSSIEFFIAADRLLELPDRRRAIIASLAALGQPVWNPPSPKGYPDGNAHWTSPAGMKARLDFAARAAADTALFDPKELVAEAFGDAVSKETRAAIRGSESRAQGIAILLMSPEFQRR